METALACARIRSPWPRSVQKLPRSSTTPFMLVSEISEVSSPNLAQTSIHLFVIYDIPFILTLFFARCKSRIFVYPPQRLKNTEIYTCLFLISYRFLKLRR